MRLSDFLNINITSQTEWTPIDTPVDTVPGNPASSSEGSLPFSLPDDVLSSTFLLGNVGAPFVIGLAVGYFAKKVLKIALFLGGALIVALFVSEYYGLTSGVSNSGLQSAADAATAAARDSGHFLMERLSQITAKGVSATAGFLVGLKFG